MSGLSAFGRLALDTLFRDAVLSRSKRRVGGHARREALPRGFRARPRRSMFKAVNSTGGQGRGMGRQATSAFPFSLSAFQPSSFIVHPSSFALALILAFSIVAQPAPPPTVQPAPPPAPPPVQESPHGIDGVDPVSADSAIANPLPLQQQRPMKKYELPALAGGREGI